MYVKVTRETDGTCEECGQFGKVLEVETIDGVLVLCETHLAEWLDAQQLDAEEE